MDTRKTRIKWEIWSYLANFSLSLRFQIMGRDLIRWNVEVPDSILNLFDSTTEELNELDAEDGSVYSVFLGQIVRGGWIMVEHRNDSPDGYEYFEFWTPNGKMTVETVAYSPNPTHEQRQWALCDSFGFVILWDNTLPGVMKKIVERYNF